MKHAFCIIAHNEFELLKRLLCELDDARCDIFLHVDAKAEKINEQEFERLLKFSRLYFVERSKVTWGGYSMIDCELRMLKKAQACGDYGYYHILSGVDFPIKSKKYFYDFFEANNGKQFIHYCPDDYNTNSIFRYKYYYFFQEKIGRSKNIYKILEKVMLLLQRPLVDRRKQFPGIHYKGGAQWCSITNELVSYLLDREEKIQKMFRHTVCCDEFFIQTMVYNSPFYKNVYDAAPRNENEPSMRMIDWERGKPYTFQLEDYEELKNSECLFARKFSLRTKEDDKLLEQLSSDFKKDDGEEETKEMENDNDSEGVCRKFFEK